MNNYGIFTEDVATMNNARETVFLSWTDSIAHSYDCLNDAVLSLLAEIWQYNCSAENSYNKVMSSYQEEAVEEQINIISREISSV